MSSGKGMALRMGHWNPRKRSFQTYFICFSEVGVFQNFRENTYVLKNCTTSQKLRFRLLRTCFFFAFENWFLVMFPSFTCSLLSSACEHHACPSLYKHLLSETFQSNDDFGRWSQRISLAARRVVPLRGNAITLTRSLNFLDLNAD